MCSLWQDISLRTKSFDLVTLTLTFDLLLKNLNLRHNFLTKRDGAFILHLCISCGKTFLVVPENLTPDLDLDSWPIFLWPDLAVDTKIFDFVTSTLNFDLLLKKNLTLAISFEPKEIGLSYFTCVFLVARPFCWKQLFYLVTLTLTFTYFWKKINLDHNFWTKSCKALILHISIPCCKTSLLIPIFLT